MRSNAVIVRPRFHAMVAFEWMFPLQVQWQGLDVVTGGCR